MTELQDFDSIQEIANRYKTIESLLLMDSQGAIKFCLHCDDYDMETISTVLSTTIPVFQNHLAKLEAPSWKQICIRGQGSFVYLRRLSADRLLVLLIHSDREIKSFLEEIQQRMNITA